MQVAAQVTKFPAIAVPPPVRVATGTVIDVPCQLVFDRVARLDAVPLTAGRFGARWVVRVSEPSRRWCVETFTLRGWASVDYELDETSTGCFLRETVEFRSHGWRRTLDEGLTRLQIERQSRRALARLKASLEEHHGAGVSRTTLSPAT